MAHAEDISALGMVWCWGGSDGPRIALTEEHLRSAAVKKAIYM
jgi:hypothetical protein